MPKVREAHGRPVVQGQQVGGPEMPREEARALTHDISRPEEPTYSPRGNPTMSDAPPQPCPRCGKPMAILLSNDKKVAALKCLNCDNVDPLKDPQVGGWIKI